MSEITRRPTTIASAVAAAGATVAIVAGSYETAYGLLLGAVGAALLAAGLVRGHRIAVDAGCGVLFLCVVAGGIAGASVEAALLGTIGVVLSWDLGQSAIDLGDQLGREAETRRLELAHAGSSLLVGLTAATVGYAVYTVAADGQPVAAVVLALLAAVFVTTGLGVKRRKTDRRSGRVR